MCQFGLIVNQGNDHLHTTQWIQIVNSRYTANINILHPTYYPRGPLQGICITGSISIAQTNLDCRIGISETDSFHDTEPGPLPIHSVTQCALAYDPWTLIVTNPAGSSKIL